MGDRIEAVRSMRNDVGLHVVMNDQGFSFPEHKRVYGSSHLLSFVPSCSLNYCLKGFLYFWRKFWSHWGGVDEMGSIDMSIVSEHFVDDFPLLSTPSPTKNRQASPNESVLQQSSTFRISRIGRISMQRRQLVSCGSLSTIDRDGC